MSFEKRDNIRPVGVVSKKDNGARRQPCKMLRCIAVAAYKQPMAGASAVRIDRKPDDERKVPSGECEPHMSGGHGINVRILIVKTTMVKKKVSSKQVRKLQQPGLIIKNICTIIIIQRTAQGRPKNRGGRIKGYIERTTIY